MATLGDRAPTKRWSTFWQRKPVATFVIASGLLYFLLSPYLPSGKETIRIDARTVAGIVERRTNLEARELTAAERTQAIEDYVQEEMLLREAYRNGWHLEQGRVRRRLVLAMRTAMSEDLPEPTSPQLRAYFQANADRYRTPPSITFEQVFFEADSERAPRDPNALLELLSRGADHSSIGDELWLGSRSVRQSRHQLAAVLGASFAEKMFLLTPGSWIGPVESSRGTHFVRVEERAPPVLPELAVVQPFVRADWAKQRHGELQERKMERIRERYSIRRDPL